MLVPPAVYSPPGFRRPLGENMRALLLEIVVSAARLCASVHNVLGRAWSGFSVYTVSDEWWREHAKRAKEVIQASTGCIDRHYPHTLDEPARCAMCRFSTFVLFQADEICGQCWHARLERTNERDYPPSDASRIIASVRAHLLL